MPRHRGPIEIGSRSRLVTIQQLTESVGASGMPVETWSRLATEWMSREETGGAERLRTGQVTASIETCWVGPYRPDCDPELVDVPKKRRLLYGSQPHDIVSAARLGQKDGIEYMTRAASIV